MAVHSPLVTLGPAPLGMFYEIQTDTWGLTECSTNNVISTKVSKTWKISQLFKSKSSTGLSTSSSSSGDTAADTASAPSLSFLTSTHLESGQFTLPPRE